MRILRALRFAAVGLAMAASAGSITMLQGCGGSGSSSSGGCCKVCTTGKACGDTCIPVTQQCRTTGGCACDG